MIEVVLILAARRFAMPIPKPNKGEKKNDYMSRCVKFLSNENKGTQEQRVAICMSQFNRKTNGELEFSEAELEQIQMVIDKMENNE